MEHLTNCHGEVTLAFELLFGLPFVGFWARRLFLRVRSMIPSARSHGDHVNS